MKCQGKDQLSLSASFQDVLKTELGQWEPIFKWVAVLLGLVAAVYVWGLRGRVGCSVGLRGHLRC